MKKIFLKLPLVKTTGDTTPPIARLAYAIIGGNLFYALLLLNFDIFEESLETYIYRSTSNPEKSLAAIVMISILGAFLALRVPHHRSLVGSFSHFSFVLLFIPLCAIYTLSDGSTAFVAACCSALAASFFLFGRHRDSELGLVPSLDRIIMLLFLSIVVFVFVNIGRSRGLEFSFLSFRDVYNLRSSMQSDDVSNLNRAITISGYVSISFLLIYGIIYSRHIIILSSLLFSYILYNTFGFKLLLFFPIITISFYIYYMYLKTYSVMLVIIIVMIIFYIDKVTGINSTMLSAIGELVIRRYLYAPGYILFAWYDTFINHPLVFMSNIFGINKIIIYPYDINYSYVVANNIFNIEFNPNTSIIGYGFANFGYIGIFIYLFFIYSIMGFVDYTSNLCKSIYLRLSSLSPSFLFFEADPIVVFVSFGFGIIFMICAVIVIVRPRFRKTPLPIA